MGKVFFTEEEIIKCKEFAYKMKGKHLHFKDKNNYVKRNEEEIIRDVISGKLAEIGLHKYLTNKHKGEDYTISKVDFDIYPRYVGDSYDLKFNDCIISIKSSKEYGSCLLIEKERFVYDEDGQAIGVDNKIDNLPDYYVFIRIKVDLNNINNTYAEIMGTISHKNFMYIKKEAPRGMVLNKKNGYDFFVNNKNPIFTGRGFPLLATNYGVHITQLKQF